MIALFLLAAAPLAGHPPALPCVPVPSDHLAPTPSTLQDHQALREALNEPMPGGSAMVTLLGKGGHHSTQEYSVVLVRNADAAWQGTAVGRSKFNMKGAPFEPMKRAEWKLGTTAAKQLDDAIARRCPFDRSAAARGIKPGPPPLGYIGERIEVIVHGRETVTYYAMEGDGVIANLIRPPQSP